MNKPKKIIPCAGCAIIENNKLLLLLKREHQHFEFPGGQVEEGETLEQAAIRETLEETGCEVEITKYFGYSDIKPDASSETVYRGHVFLAKRKAGQTPRLADSTEHEAIRWIMLDDYHNEPLAPNVREFCRTYLTGKKHRATIKT